jgi:anti-sigma-K factor RskA
MKHQQRIEKLIKDQKPTAQTNGHTDDRVLADSFAAMQKTQTEPADKSTSRSPSKRAKLAAAAVIVVAVGLLLHPSPDEQAETVKSSKITRSPVEMLTVISLNFAYRRGGMDAVEKQCDEAFRQFRLPPRSLSVEQLLAEFNGNDRESERTRL